MTDVTSAAELAVFLLDEGSTQEFGALPALPADPDYAASITKARAKSGSPESVRTWRGTLAGVPTILIAGEFGFLAGSVGIAAAERIVTAIQAATAEGRAIVAAPTSGGTRMQEGTPAFVRMVPIGTSFDLCPTIAESRTIASAFLTAAFTAVISQILSSISSKLG